MTIVTGGIGLAKNVFAVHGLGESGKAEPMRPDVPCARPLERIAMRLVGASIVNFSVKMGKPQRRMVMSRYCFSSRCAIA